MVPPACQSNQESHPALTHQQSTPPPLGSLTGSLEAEWSSCLLRGCCISQGSCGGLSFCLWRETFATLFEFSSSGWKYLFQIANTCNCWMCPPPPPKAVLLCLQRTDNLVSAQAEFWLSKQKDGWVVVGGRWWWGRERERVGGEGMQYKNLHSAFLRNLSAETSYHFVSFPSVTCGK